MEQPLTAVYDANILYPAPLRDLFIRLAQARLMQAKWTEAIHEEWMRNVLKGNPRLSAARSLFFYSFLCWISPQSLSLSAALLEGDSPPSSDHLCRCGAYSPFTIRT